MRYCVCLSVCVSLFDPCASMCVNALRFQWPPDSDTSSAHYQPLPLHPSLFPSCDTCLRLFTDMSQRTCNILHSILSRVSLYLPCALCIFYLQWERQRARGREGEWQGETGREGKANIVYFRRSCLNVDCQLIVRHPTDRAAPLRESMTMMMIFVSTLAKFSISISVSTSISILSQLTGLHLSK